MLTKKVYDVVKYNAPVSGTLLKLGGSGIILGVGLTSASVVTFTVATLIDYAINPESCKDDLMQINSKRNSA